EKLVKSDPTAQAEAIEGFVRAVGDMWKRYRAQEPWTSEQMSQMADNMADLFGGVVGGTNAVKDLLLQRGTIRPDAPAPVPPPVATPGPK
ncbi:hypothetical protein HZB96_02570, partial [Candidatus Gottesmanbacteria bacterium]|nr:hypothetical protein [Candidatus Gottesmanbacteria bacterium]